MFLMRNLRHANQRFLGRRGFYGFDAAHLHQRFSAFENCALNNSPPFFREQPMRAGLDTPTPTSYRCEAATIAGFIQQLAVGCIARGYWFYVAGYIPPYKDAKAV